MSACQACGENNPSESKFCGGCGQPLAERGASVGLVGRTIADRYRVIRVIAEGGMGIVYEAIQTMGEGTRHVAIKTLLPELSQDHVVVSRFTRECAVVASLEHPNTVRVYDFGKTEDGILYIAMEYVRGRPLGDVLAEGKMPLARTLAIVEQIALALAEAHGLGIVHRDLKPDNVVLCERAGIHDFVKLLDFGIAMRSSQGGKHDTKLTQQGMVLGTPPYMSPEQFTGETIDSKSDIYSLAVIVYEMLNGRLPFEAETPWQWAHHHLSSIPAPFSVDSARVVESTVLRALDKQRQNRPESALDFYRQLAVAAGITGDRARIHGLPAIARTEPPLEALVLAAHPPAAAASTPVFRTEPSMAMPSRSSVGDEGRYANTYRHAPPAAGSTEPEGPRDGTTEPGTTSEGHRTGTEPNVPALLSIAQHQHPLVTDRATPGGASPGGLSPVWRQTPQAMAEPAASRSAVASAPPARPRRRRNLVGWIAAGSLVVGGASASLVYAYYYYQGAEVLPPPMPIALNSSDSVVIAPDATAYPPSYVSGNGMVPNVAPSRTSRAPGTVAPRVNSVPGGNIGTTDGTTNATTNVPGAGTSVPATSPAASPQASPFPFPFPITLPTSGFPSPFPQANPTAPAAPAQPAQPAQPTTTPAAATPPPTATYCRQATQLAATDTNAAIDQYELCRASATGLGARLALSGLIAASRTRAVALAQQGRCSEVQAIRTALGRVGRQRDIDVAVAQTPCATQ